MTKIYLVVVLGKGERRVTGSNSTSVWVLRNPALLPLMLMLMFDKGLLKEPFKGGGIIIYYYLLLWSLYIYIYYLFVLLV